MRCIVVCVVEWCSDLWYVKVLCEYKNTILTIMLNYTHCAHYVVSTKPHACIVPCISFLEEYEHTRLCAALHRLPHTHAIAAAKEIA